ncbi:MAG: hypothetical protein D6729_19860 [Deltaproteobacteria bacterium]|nr:MAG: hypothetical protein D6729_19860 [Deltaproteobacteria bacterium]
MTCRNPSWRESRTSTEGGPPRSSGGSRVPRRRFRRQFAAGRRRLFPSDGLSRRVKAAAALFLGARGAPARAARRPGRRGLRRGGPGRDVSAGRREARGGARSRGAAPPHRRGRGSRRGWASSAGRRR